MAIFGRLSSSDSRAKAQRNIGISTGQYTAVAADATANQMTIPTGLRSCTNAIVSIRRSASEVISDAQVSISGTNILIQDNTYSTTAGDVVSWVAFGS